MRNKGMSLLLLFIMPFCCFLVPHTAMCTYSADGCTECHFSRYGSPTEACESCHQGALHYTHVYQEPGKGVFPLCGTPANACKCCHGDPPDYETPPVVAQRCVECHGVASSNIVGTHECSVHYDPPDARCIDCHSLIPGHSVIPEEDGNDNCNDTVDNDADCFTDHDDPDCTVPASSEICDDGKDNDYDGLIDGFDPDCCGDHVISPPEECDDGNTIECDGCSTTCTRESCGDGKLCMAIGEECDDGNTVDCDGCSSDCQVEYCGDGKICPRIGEECDGSSGCPEGFYCDAKCTCRREALSCGTSIASPTDEGGGGYGINLLLYVIPCLYLLFLRRQPE